MSRKCVLQFLVASVMAVTMGGCSLFQALSQGFKSPTVEFKDVVLRDVSSKGIKLDFKFDVTNPNPVGARIASLDYDLQINGARVAKGRSQRAIELPASGTSEVLFPYELQFQDLVSTLKALLSLKTKVPYRLDLVIAVDTPIGIIEVSRRAEGEFDLPQPKLTGAGLPF